MSTVVEVEGASAVRDPEEVRERRVVRRVYDRIASQYDRRVGPISEVDRYFIAVEAAFVLAHVGAGDRVLDVGCGTGRYTVQFLDTTPAVVGLDLSLAMVGQARSKALGGERQGRGGWAQGEMACLPFASGSFDVVTCVLAMMHLARSERQRVFDEVARVLVPGGRFVFTCKNAVFERFSSVDRFATVDQTDVANQRLRFTRLEGSRDLEAQWNSFLPADLRRLCARAGLTMTDLRGHLFVGAWLPDRFLRSERTRAVVRRIEHRLGDISPFDGLGYHLLVEAVKPTRT
jgi:ubiquinone/menaquinone biosynthesis C-methylase UbiE